LAITLRLQAESSGLLLVTHWFASHAGTPRVPWHAAGSSHVASLL